MLHGTKEYLASVFLKSAASERQIVRKQTPSKAQKDAGNYKKLHIHAHGLRISIENPRGSIRSGVSKDGKKWSNTLTHDYGYVRESCANDSDCIDVFLSPRFRTAKVVHIIDQVDPKTGKFDEHKCMIGWDSQEEAKKAYLSNYEKGWQGLGDVVTLTMAGFKKWVYDELHTKKPAGPVVKKAFLKILIRK